MLKALLLGPRTGTVGEEGAVVQICEAPAPAAYQEALGLLCEEAKQYLNYQPDGKLYVSSTHRFNPMVTGFVGALRRKKLAFQLQYVDLAVISQLVTAGDQAANDADASQMQRYAKLLFEKAVKLRASDIHIRCSEGDGTEILMRILGDLEKVEEHPYRFGDRLCTTIYNAMANVSDGSFKPLSRQDARIADRAKIPEGIDGIRIATTPQTGGYVMVLRMLYNDTVESFDLRLLGYMEEQNHAVELMKRRPHGINIIAGPTGAGKSTTLQRVLGAIIEESQGKKHVITVEDPPEYPIVGAVQTPVTNAESEEERARAFQGAIKAAMRLDPDVIMIGEIRDTASAMLAIRAAMTGHQVWSTLHANGAFAILDRLLDLGVPLEMLTDHTIVSGLTCQRLVKTLCPHCKVPFTTAMSEISPRDVNRVMSVVDVQGVFVQGPGCPHCMNRGSSGRTVVAETVITDASMMVHIRKRDRIAALDYWKRDQTGRTMLSHALEKISAGLIDPFAAEDVVGPLNMESIEADHRINPMEVHSAIG